ncbi:permease [Halalkalibacter alkalisediminis]|uniref:Permease n=1 Tax=Halalkalibacter alkalisediminis TaxID=935616 RepID=A0ABV6NP02_9BACI|nr:permease [Halalkalibacter alkalisediminis]
MSNRIIYLIVGIIMAIFSLVLIIGAIIETSALLYQTYSAIAITTISFCMYYLHPHFKDKKHAKLIRKKAVFYRIIAIFVFLIFLSIGLVVDFITLSIPETISILISLIVITLFISLVINAKIHEIQLKKF